MPYVADATKVTEVLKGSTSAFEDHVLLAPMESNVIPMPHQIHALSRTIFDYPPEIRKVVYTTNAIESLNYSLRKIIKERGAFPHDDAIRKLLYLGLKNSSKKWTMPIRDWKAALNQFIILFGDRVPV